VEAFEGFVALAFEEEGLVVSPAVKFSVSGGQPRPHTKSGKCTATRSTLSGLAQICSYLRSLSRS
jgi:hypothetical protein